MFTLQHHLKLGPNFSRSKYCDTKLTTKDSRGGGFISAHRAILAAVSKKLEKTFDDNLDSVEPIVIKNVDFDVLEKIIHYVYAGYANFAGDEVDYEDFCDGMATLKIDVGDECKTSLVVEGQTVDHIEVKTEPLEDVEIQNSTGKSLINLSPVEKAPEATFGLSVPVQSVAPICNVGSFNSAISGARIESADNLLVSSDAVRENSEKQSTTNFDINDNNVSSVLIRSDIFKTKQETFDTQHADEDDDIEILEVKEVVELFLQELSPKVSESQVRNYFSSFGEVKDVDLMESVYGQNSGLGVVKIVIDEKSKKEVSKLCQVVGCQFKLLLDNEIVGKAYERLDKRFADNYKKVRMSGIGSGVTRYDLINVFGRDNIQEVFIDGDEGYIQFDKISFANDVLNGEFIALNDDKIKVYRSWRDSTRFKLTSQESRGRSGYSRSSSRRSRSRSRSKTRSRKRKHSR